LLFCFVFVSFPKQKQQKQQKAKCAALKAKFLLFFVLFRHLISFGMNKHKKSAHEKRAALKKTGKKRKAKSTPPKVFSKNDPTHHKTQTTCKSTNTQKKKKGFFSTRLAQTHRPKKKEKRSQLLFVFPREREPCSSLSSCNWTVCFFFFRGVVNESLCSALFLFRCFLCFLARSGFFLSAVRCCEERLACFGAGLLCAFSFRALL
jgi:hypothetical protein